MQHKIFNIEEKLPHKSTNVIGLFDVVECKETKKRWIVTSYNPDTEKWEKNRVPIMWTWYPPLDGDNRFL